MVRVGTPSAVARPAWHDRSAVSRADAYDGLAVTPHTATERIAYTCPAGKKAMLELVQVRCRRNAVATTLGIVKAYCMFTPSGGSIKEILSAYLNDNTVNARDAQAQGTTLVLCTGDIISLRTYDLSTGGTCDYFLTYKLTEFDA